MKKLLFLTVLLTMVFVTGCGSNGSDNTKAGAAEESNALQRIKDRGKLIIATSGNYRPVTFTDDNGELAGTDIEVGKLLAEGLGVDIEFVTGNISGLIPGMVSGKFDLVMSGLMTTEERKKTIDFSTAYGYDGTIAVTLDSSTAVQDVSKLDGLIAGVIGGSAHQPNVEAISGYKELKEYPGNAEAFADLKNGRMDVYATGRIVANDFIRNDEKEPKLKMVGEVYNALDIAVGMPKEEPELKEAINKIIEEKREDGTLAQIEEKWFGFTFDE
jgi:ABC-type amino acid transport/signal transduction systems, periplasmic component/domain